MSHDMWRSSTITRRLASAAVIAATLGCERGDANGPKRADSVSRGAAAQPATGSFAAPTSGFTSAQGTPPTQPAPAVASAAAAARTAPQPPATLVTRANAEEQAAIRVLPAGPGHELVLGNCLSCHAATMITQQHKDTAGWNKTVTQMIAWGAPVAKDKQAALVGYLVEHFPARAAGEPARPAP